jgi:hypothetical protein
LETRLKISQATTSETSDDHFSAVLNATTRFGSLYSPCSILLMMFSRSACLRRSHDTRTQVGRNGRARCKRSHRSWAPSLVLVRRYAYEHRAFPTLHRSGRLFGFSTTLRLMLRLRASIKLTTFEGSRCFGASIFSPACFFFLKQLFDCVFILIFELLRIECARLCLDDVGC